MRENVIISLHCHATQCIRVPTMAKSSRTPARNCGFARGKKPLVRPDQVTVSGLPEDTHERLGVFSDGSTIKKSDVARNALLAGLRQFEADGYEVVPPTRIQRRAR
jgi:hypothetical protein